MRCGHRRIHSIGSNCPARKETPHCRRRKAGAAQGFRNDDRRDAVPRQHGIGDRRGTRQVRARRGRRGGEVAATGHPVGRCRSRPPIRRGHPRGDADASAFGRRRRRHTMVRAFRHRTARGDGLRCAGGRFGGRRDAGHRRERRDGKTSAAKDSRALAEAIGPILWNERLRGTLGEAGRRRVCRRYTWAKVADDTLRVYQRVADGGRVHPLEWSVS